LAKSAHACCSTSSSLRSSRPPAPPILNAHSSESVFQARQIPQRRNRLWK
jgi:hypothetical protein